MGGILELIKLIYGSKALSKVLGTRTNVIRLPDNELKQYTKKELNIEAASNKLAQKAKADMYELLAEYPRMNDAERLIFDGNLRRLGNKLEVVQKKQKPAADVLEFETGEKVSPEGIMSLTEKAGQKNPPTTLMGKLESRVKQLEASGEDLSKMKGQTYDEFMNDITQGQRTMIKLEDEGLVRATAREIIDKDIKSKKIKLPKEIEADFKQGGGEPIDVFRQFYGEDALEQLNSMVPDFRRMYSPREAAEAATKKFNFEFKADRPPGSISIEDAKKAEQEFNIVPADSEEGKVITEKLIGKPKASVTELVTAEKIILDMKNMDPMDAMKEANKVLKREGKYKNLKEEDVERIMEDTNDFIFGRDIPEDPEGFAGGGRVGFKEGSGYFSNLIKENIPPEYRLYAKSILPGGKKGNVDESYFTEDFKKDLRQQVLTKFKETGKLKGSIGELDTHYRSGVKKYGQGEKYPINKLIGLPSTYATLGSYNYEIDPETLDVKIKDTYDWNPAYGKDSSSGKTGWVGDKKGKDVDTSMLKDYVMQSLKTGVIDKGDALELLGNYLGPKASKGEGINVDIDIPAQDIPMEEGETFATGGRVRMAGGGVSQGLDYLMGIERRGYQEGSTLTDLFKRYEDIQTPSGPALDNPDFIPETALGNIERGISDFLKSDRGLKYGKDIPLDINDIYSFIEAQRRSFSPDLSQNYQGGDLYHYLQDFYKYKYGIPRINEYGYFDYPGEDKNEKIFKSYFNQPYQYGLNQTTPTAGLYQTTNPNILGYAGDPTIRPLRPMSPTAVDSSAPASTSVAETLFPQGDFLNIRETAASPTEYNIEATKDLVENLPSVLQPFAPAAAAALSLPYDAIQAYQRMEPDSGIAGFRKAFQAERPLKSAFERFVGASGPLAENINTAVSSLNPFQQQRYMNYALENPDRAIQAAQRDQDFRTAIERRDQKQKGGLSYLLGM
jgi:hypothetical protein